MGEAAAPAAAHEGSAEVRHVKYYFAYGSNLHMKQMQRRCPNSRYVGFGRLPNFRWQINERGYANVVHAQGQWVDGLVYEIEETDEEKLDISEGVAKGAYEKQHMQVRVKLACCSLYRRSVPWIVARGGPCRVRKSAKHSHRRTTTTTTIDRDTDNVLVYMSLVHVVDSSPKEEYIDRINRGLKDAACLGMEDDYIRNCIRPFVPESASSSRETPTPTRSNSPRASEAGV
ncbi:AIG2 family protein [Metarhizium album ARSEF 1941]|uniref:gamma-glutamylcyclotransferase n=1 Tax=Metarhizium album (strain ARSEF 1941) TaxID=1081103 RepID=A0A0B2X431_METAS|nr:AIG2 family protein [Metarhizium album ARSEF 1941]KHO00180.1 AIG2 family protein [Metarhizium album ARSEF 1941]